MKPETTAAGQGTAARLWGKVQTDFGLARVIIVGLFVLMFVGAGLMDMNTASFFGDVIRRWGMWGVIVLAMLPSIQSGVGPNFGVPLGILGGLVGATVSIELNHRGLFGSITNPYLNPIVLALVAIVVALIISVAIGILYGMLLNKVKGSEMAITVYVGFSAVALFNILWAMSPFITADIAILPATGRGLRQMVNLDQDFGNAFDQLLRFEIGGMTVRLGLVLVFLVFCLIIWMFTRSRTGMMMSAAGANPNYARASGINVDKMRIIGTTLSTALAAVGIVIYAQSFGFLQYYAGPNAFTFQAVAAVLVGGATVRRARVFDVIFGAFIFHGILTIALPLATELLPPELRAGVPEMLRAIATNGIILYALTKIKGGSR
ncbi:MAG: ABC transporter permease [Oscillospiraceae bacterium]|nr:ABC transporter permease [Oscillospiraceae bacterium]